MKHYLSLSVTASMIRIVVLLQTLLLIATNTLSQPVVKQFKGGSFYFPMNSKLDSLDFNALHFWDVPLLQLNREGSFKKINFGLVPDNSFNIEYSIDTTFEYVEDPDTHLFSKCGIIGVSRLTGTYSVTGKFITIKLDYCDPGQCEFLYEILLYSEDKLLLRKI